MQAYHSLENFLIFGHACKDAPHSKWWRETFWKEDNEEALENCGNTMMTAWTNFVRIAHTHAHAHARTLDKCTPALNAGIFVIYIMQRVLIQCGIRALWDTCSNSVWYTCCI